MTIRRGEGLPPAMACVLDATSVRGLTFAVRARAMVLRSPVEACDWSCAVYCGEGVERGGFSAVRAASKLPWTSVSVPSAARRSARRHVRIHRLDGDPTAAFRRPCPHATGHPQAAAARRDAAATHPEPRSRNFLTGGGQTCLPGAALPGRARRLTAYARRRDRRCACPMTSPVRRRPGSPQFVIHSRLPRARAACSGPTAWRQDPHRPQRPLLGKQRSNVYRISAYGHQGIEGVFC